MRFALYSVFSILGLALIYSNAAIAEQSSDEKTRLGLQTSTKVDDDKSNDELSLGDIFDLPVSLPSKTQQSSTEAPSIVSVITRKEIETYGDRDMVDILRRVPGFEFGTDTIGIIATGFRGIWVEEGKLQFMINGITVNDLGYENINFFGTFPASMIERVEVLRGPGSSLYGGLAEVAIVNIVTRNGKDLNGVEVRGFGGAMGASAELMSRGGNVAWGTKTKDLETSFEMGINQTPLSSGTYKDYSGNSLPLGNSSAGRQWFHLMAQATYKDALTLKYLKFNNTFIGNIMSGTVTPPIYNRYQERALYNQEGFSAKYTHKLSESLRIEPSFDYVSGPQAGQEALQSGVLSSVNGPNGTMLEKYKGEISVSYDPDKQSNVVGGVGYIRDQGESINSDGSPAFYGSNASDLQFKRAVESMFLYGQYMRKIGDFNLTAGARYENTSFGSAVAPRVGITYQYDKYNAKLLYGRSYRIPSVYQAYSNLLNYNPDGLKPETSNTLEAEFGYRISKNMNSKINLFLIEINQLIYFATVGSSYYYANFSGVQQSYGAEAELNYKEKDYGAYLNASLAMPGQQSNAVYLTNDKKYALGLPPLKVTFGGYFNLAKLVVSPTFEVLSRRYGVGADGVTSQGYDALFLANLAVTWKEIIENTDLRLSGHNLLNSNYVLLQPYYGSNAPLPANNRDVRLEFQTRL